MSPKIKSRIQCQEIDEVMSMYVVGNGFFDADCSWCGLWSSGLSPFGYCCIFKNFVSFYFILFFDCVLFAWFQIKHKCLRYFWINYISRCVFCCPLVTYICLNGCLQGHRVHLLPYFCDVSLLKILGDRVQWRCSHVVRTRGSHTTSESAFILRQWARGEERLVVWRRGRFILGQWKFNLPLPSFTSPQLHFDFCAIFYRRFLVVVDFSAGTVSIFSKLFS